MFASLLPEEGAGGAYIIGLAHDLYRRFGEGAQPLCDAIHVGHKLWGIPQPPEAEEAKQVMSPQPHFLTPVTDTAFIALQRHLPR